MKSFIILIVLSFTSYSLSAQIVYDKWEATSTVDDFGDATGDTVYRYFAKGTFSNSATAASELTVKVVDYGTSVYFYLYEYNRSKASLAFESKTGEISVKRESGDVEIYKAFYFEKSEALVFSEDDKFLKVLKSTKGEKLKVLVKEANFSNYGKSRYTFTIKTRS